MWQKINTNENCSSGCFWENKEQKCICKESVWCGEKTDRITKLLKSQPCQHYEKTEDEDKFFESNRYERIYR